MNKMNIWNVKYNLDQIFQTNITRTFQYNIFKSKINQHLFQTRTLKKGI